MEVHMNIAAADHAEIENFVFGQTEIFQTGALLPQHLGGHLLTAVLHGAAADGAVDAACVGDQHISARPAGSGAATGDDADQNGILAAGHSLIQKSK